MKLASLIRSLAFLISQGSLAVPEPYQGMAAAADADMGITPRQSASTRATDRIFFIICIEKPPSVLEGGKHAFCPSEELKTASEVVASKVVASEVVYLLCHKNNDLARILWYNNQKNMDFQWFADCL